MCLLIVGVVYLSDKLTLLVFLEKKHGDENLNDHFSESKFLCLWWVVNSQLGIIITSL